MILPYIPASSKFRHLLSSFPFNSSRATCLLALSVAAGSLSASDTPQDIVLSIPGCVAFWDFNESSGSAYSLTPSVYPLNEADGSVARVTDGPFGRSADLRQGSAHFATPSDLLPDLNIYKGGSKENMTVVAWINPTSTGSGFIAGKWAEGELGSYSPGKRQYGLFIGLDGSNQVIGHVSVTGNNSPGYPYNNDKSYSPQIIPTGKWSCVAFSYDGAFIRSYFNGVFQANGYRNPYAYTDGAGDNGADFTVGRNEYRGQMNNVYRGLIGGVAVFNRPLSESELATLAAINTVQTPQPTPEAITLTPSSLIYEENFDQLNSEQGLSNDWNNGATLKGWFASINGTAYSGPYLTWDGTAPKQNQPLSLGSPGESDRALGFQTNNQKTPIRVALCLHNQTDAQIEVLGLSYDAEQWRTVINDAVDGYSVDYQIFPRGKGSIDSPTGWNPIEALAFNTPINGTVSLALDGNAPENRVSKIQATLFDLQWNSDSELWIRWNDLVSSRQIIAIDNVRLEAALPDVSLLLDSEGSPAINFHRAYEISELNYIVEASNDLLSWTSIATNPGNPGSRVTFSGPQSEPPFESHFMRLLLQSGIPQ